MRRQQQIHHPDETPATDPSPDETPEAPTERNAENILAKISADSGGSVVGTAICSTILMEMVFRKHLHLLM